MKACLKWRTQQTKPVHYRTFKHIDHGNMIKADEPVSSVADLVDEINTKSLSNIRDNENILQPSFRHISRFLSLTFLNHCVEKRAL